jgi:hypothetical protein
VVAESQVTNVTVPGTVPTTPPVSTTSVEPVAPAVAVGPALPAPVAQADVQQPAMQPMPARAGESTLPAAAGPSTNNQGARPLPLPQRPQPINSGGPQVPTAPPVAPPNAVAPAPRGNADAPQRTSNHSRAAAVNEAQQRVAAGPQARCGGRNPFSQFICMERECLRSEQVSHADCQKWRQNAKRD